MSIAHSFMSFIIHRAGFMSIARYEFYDNIGSMYELCSYYDNGFIMNELCSYISCMTFIMIPNQRCIYLFMWPHVWPQDFFFVVQKYLNQGISCKYIQIRVFCAEILIRYRYALHSHARLTIWIGHGCNVYSFSGSIDQ